MGNLASGGCGCDAEDEEFEPFQDTGGKVHVLICAMDYPYAKGNELTGTQDGDRMQQICRAAGAEEYEVFYDTDPLDSESFPTKKRLQQKIREFGEKTGPDDYFVFFYAGHGENVPDVDGDEDDGQDEAFVLPSNTGSIADSNWLIDDDFVKVIEQSFNTECKILLLFDCCHSETLADLDSHHWDHRICSVSACRDSQESADTGSGGLLTICIWQAMTKLGLSRGKNEYSIESMFNKVKKDGASLCSDQEVRMLYANLDPKLTAWPLPKAWWNLTQ